MGSDGAAIAADPTLAMDKYFVPQGISADIIATEYGFTRDEADQLAVESQKRAKEAWDESRFDKSVITVRDRTACRSSIMTSTCARRPTCKASAR